MKKKNIINLIKYHTENNEAGFRTEALEVADDFQRNGDEQLAEYIMALLSDANTFIPQTVNDDRVGDFLEKISEVSSEPLPLPECIKEDVLGLANAVARNMGIGKFLFEGAPGTGKTETAIQLSRILSRELYSVNIPQLVDSRLGQTPKNIVELFNNIRELHHPEQALILFDELDALAMDRTNSRDLREMGRAVSTFLKEFERLDSRVVMVATTNLYKNFDEALIRRFDAVINFDRYTQEDLREIAEILFKNFINVYNQSGKNLKLFKKIIRINKELPLPGNLKNIIKAAIAFSDPNNESEYLKRLYLAFTGQKYIDFSELKSQGYTLREIEILSGVPRSSLSRNLKLSQEQGDE